MGRALICAVAMDTVRVIMAYAAVSLDIMGQTAHYEDALRGMRGQISLLLMI